MRRRGDQRFDLRTGGLLWQSAYYARLFLGDVAHRIIGPWTLARTLTFASRLMDLRAPRAMYIALGLEPWVIQDLLDRLSGHAGEGMLRRRKSALIVTDSPTFATLIRHDVLMEYIPDRPKVRQLDPSIDYEAYLFRRIAHLARQYEPARLVHVGSDGGVTKARSLQELEALLAAAIGADRQDGRNVRRLRRAGGTRK